MRISVAGKVQMRILVAVRVLMRISVAGRVLMRIALLWDAVAIEAVKNPLTLTLTPALSKSLHDERARSELWMHSPWSILKYSCKWLVVPEYMAT